MIYRYILLSFSFCILITILSVSINRPNSSVFIPYFVLQSSAYFTLCIISLTLNKALKFDELLSFVLSFLLSYISLFCIVWKINGKEFFEMVKEFHKGKDFWGFVTPYILSNIIAMTFMLKKKKLL